MDEPTPPKKRPLSEAELAARRANAQKSTGPTSDEGKRICRWNSLQHGLRAELPVLPGECPEAYARRLEQWIAESHVQNDMQRFVVERAVHASWKIERAESVENGIITDAMINIAAEAEEADIQETERLAALLSDEPGVSRQMRNTPAGCRFILSKLSIFEERLSRFRGLRHTQLNLLINIQGKRLTDVLRDDPLATRYVVAELSAVLGNQNVDLDRVAGRLGGIIPEGMSRVEYEERLKVLAGSLVDQKEGKTKLRAYIADFKDELTEHLRLVEELTEYKRAQAIRNARIDLGPQGKQLMQYQKKHEASFDSNLRRLAALQKPRQSPPGSGQKRKKAKKEAQPAQTSPPIPTEAPVAVTAPAPAGVPHSSGQPTAGTNGPGAAVEPTDRTDVFSGTNGPGAAVEPTIRTDVFSGTNGPGATVEPSNRTDVFSGTNGPGAAVEPTIRTDVFSGTNGPGASEAPPRRTDSVPGTNGPGASEPPPRRTEGVSGTNGPGAAITETHAGLAVMRSPPHAATPGG
jgi:hypothetical protein